MLNFQLRTFVIFSIDESSSKSSTPQSKKSNTSTPKSSPKTTNGKLKDDKDQYFIVSIKISVAQPINA